MSERFSRSSLRRLGLTRASSNKTSAKPRSIQPRPRVITVITMKARPATKITARSGQGRIGAMVKSQVIPPLLPQSFEQGRNVHLVGFVVAGQGIHHDVDSG